MKKFSLMVLGTSSHAGKSAVTAGLCRLLARRGVRVAPFKAQNMSLNSFVTPEGAEIGRAQAFQARAAGVECHADMNPVLLKPSGGNRVQVMVQGKAQGHCTAREYYAHQARWRRQAHLAYDRLSARFDALVLEGAGSPAEINLRDSDFVNASMAEYAGARCLLVADIDRGGVFASILGTVRLLPPRHRRLLSGIIINKFRGDPSLLDSGLREIERLTGVPVLGVLPYLENLGLYEEDSLGLAAEISADSTSAATRTASGELLDIAVIRLPHISNFTDFQPLERDAAFRLRYVASPQALGNPDFLILPGSKCVRADLRFLRDNGLDRVIVAAAKRHIPVFGICGGYQMLGTAVKDPHGIEGRPGKAAGLGLLPVETVMEMEKQLCRVRVRNLAAPFMSRGRTFTGYEIHMGHTSLPGNRRMPIWETTSRNGKPCREPSGHAATGLPVFGAYVHGMFDDAPIRRGLMHWLRERKGLPPRPASRPTGDNPYDRLADALETVPGLRSLLADLSRPEQ